METKFIDLLKDILEIEDRDLNLTDEFRQYPEWDSLGYLELQKTLMTNTSNQMAS